MRANRQISGAYFHAGAKRERKKRISREEPRRGRKPMEAERREELLYRVVHTSALGDAGPNFQGDAEMLESRKARRMVLPGRESMILGY
ncbi:hypothetical protein KM043_014562 [Ampulex compressa]|nr:hypothetical protein KM043_014562 [Ampulex compressa]